MPGPQDFVQVTEGQTLRVTGLRATSRALAQAGDQSTDMKDLMRELGTIVARAADPPVLSGRLAGSVRAGGGKTKAVVRAGGARVPYAGVLEYGWPARNIEATGYLQAALTEKRSDVIQRLEEGIGDLLRRNDLI